MNNQNIDWNVKILNNDLTSEDIEYLSTLSTEYLTENKEKKYLQNYEALAELKNKQSIYDRAAMLLSGALAVGSTTGNFVVAGIGAAALATTGRLSQPSYRLISIIELLLEHYGKEGITITPDVKTELGTINLLVRMPDKRTFALTLKSKSHALIRWNAEANNFFVRTRRPGGMSSRADKQFIEFARSINRSAVSLKTEKSALLGTSNTEKKQPIVKALVLTNQTRIDPNNDPSLFVDFGRARVLHIKSDCSIYVVNQEDLINFLQLPEKSC